MEFPNAADFASLSTEQQLVLLKNLVNAITRESFVGIVLGLAMKNAQDNDRVTFHSLLLGTRHDLVGMARIIGESILTLPESDKGASSNLDDGPPPGEKLH